MLFFFFTEIRSEAVCLICLETVAVVKEYKISRHFFNKPANYARDLSSQERAVPADSLDASLDASLKAQQNAFIRATSSKPFSEGEFLKGT